MLTRVLCRLLGLTRLDQLLQQAEAHRGNKSPFASVIDAFKIGARVSVGDFRRIPREGPVIVVSNHPTGGLEGILVMALLEAVRGDVKTMAHEFFARWPFLARRMFLVDIRESGESNRENAAAMRRAARWVRQRKMLLCLPSANVARFDWRRRTVVDHPWRPGIVRLARISKATVLPVHVEAHNSLVFHLLAAIHPRLGALVLGRELLAKCSNSFPVRIGRPISAEEIGKMSSEAEITSALRRAVERLDPAGAGTDFRKLGADPEQVAPSS